MSDLSLAFIAQAVHRRGGQERAAAEVLSRLARKIRVTVIARTCELDDVGVRWEPVSAPSRPSLLRAWAFARGARAAEREARCDVTNAIGAAAIDADVITAQFCHAAFTARFGGLRGGTGLGAAWQRYAQRRFIEHERRAYGAPRLRSVIAVSSGTKNELMEFYRVPGDRIAVIPNGVDRAVFRPAAGAAAKAALRATLELPRDAFLGLFVGGDWERKGVREAIDAVARVKDAHLVIVGSGDSGAMHAHALGAGAAARVHFAGASASPQDYYAACDAFVFPSVYEAFSLVTLEAAASGLAIICRNINGTEELVRNGENGWFITGGAEEIAGYLTRLRDDTALRARMSAAAVASAVPYDWDRIANEQLAVFERAAAERER